MDGRVAGGEIGEWARRVLAEEEKVEERKRGRDERREMGDRKSMMGVAVGVILRDGGGMVDGILFILFCRLARVRWCAWRRLPRNEEQGTYTIKSR